MRTNRWALILWGILLIIGLAVDITSAYRTKMTNFLPHSAPLAQRVLERQVNGGAASRLLLLSIQGAPTPVLATLSQKLAQALRKSPHFIDVMNGDAQSTEPLQQFVWKNRYLLSPTTIPSQFTVATLHNTLQHDVGLLASNLGPLLSQSLAADPTNAVLGIMTNLRVSGSGPALRHGVWTSANGDAALLLVHTHAFGFDLDAQQRDIQLIQTRFDQIRSTTAGARETRIRLTGPGVFGVQTRDIIQHDVTLLSTLAILGVVLLLIYAYRSPRMLLLGLLPIISGAIIGIAVVSLQFGYVLGITLGFGITLIGEALDYATYLFTQTSRREDTNDTLKRIWPTLRLGALTSIVGFSAMLASSFSGFTQLGLFSIAGLVTSVLVTRYVLPPLVPHQFQAVGAENIARPVRWLIQHRRPVRVIFLLAVAAGALILFAYRGVTWDKNLMNLSPIPPAAQELNTRLSKELGIPKQRYFAVFSAASAQQALQKSEELEPLLRHLQTQNHIRSFDLPSNVLPSDATQRARRAALPSEPILRSRLRQALVGLPFRPGVFSPFLKDVAAAREAPLLTPDDLPPALALRFDSMLVHYRTQWVVIAPLFGVSQPRIIKQTLASRKIELVDLQEQSTALLATFQHEAIMLAIVGSLAILALLWLGLRSIRRTLKVAVPLALAVVLTAAIVTFGDAKLNIFIVMGFVLTVATGSNYCLFFERAVPGDPLWERAITSIVLANLCTVGAYGLMGFSDIPVLHDIGVTVALGTFLSLIAGALLSLPKAPEIA
ncbi:MMPL family transporter [Acidithiobacillus sp. AMEEHan]|uniref:MMPL family transporter n=1 Tax=Acidithiobacillus sp. AMEEHan TaxID=2994951 RepID=UPI0027E48E4C|nr:MMPL family transporter [Acidithiobacillus sp. AMEEHan]